MKKKESWEKEFDKKFVVTCGTKKVKRVGFWLQRTSDFPTCFYAEDVIGFIKEQLQKARREGIEEAIRALSLKELDLKDRFYGKSEIEWGFEHAYNQTVKDLENKISALKKKEGIE